MRIVCFADLHIGQKAYCKIDANTGLHMREVRAIKILNKVIDDAIAKEADCVVFAGDMFKNNLPNPTLINKVNEAFLKLSKHKIHTFILDGNHDVSKHDMFSSGLHQFHSLHVPYIIQSRFYNESLVTLGDTKYRFVFLPTHHTREDIEKLVSKLDDSYPNIIIGHLTIKNANLNDWNIIDNEECIDADIFKDKNVKAVILGHLHKHQVMNVEPLTFYCGSADRIDFSEENQEKGYVVLDVGDDVNYEFVPIKLAQKFATFKLDFSDETSAEKIENDIIAVLSKKSLKNTIVRIKIKLGMNIKLNEKRIVSYACEDKSAQHLLKIQYEFPQVEENSNQLSNSMSAFQAVEKYYEGQDRSKERILLCKQVIERVEGDVS